MWSVSMPFMVTTERIALGFEVHEQRRYVTQLAESGEHRLDDSRTSAMRYRLGLDEDGLLC